MKKVLCALVVFLSSLHVQAQSAPGVELFAGYSFNHVSFPFSTDPLAGNATGNLHGWNASASFNPNQWAGLVADFGGYYGSATGTTLFKPANCVLCTGNVTGIVHNMHTFMAGPQLSLRQQTLTVFAHVLAGGAHINADFSGVTPSATVHNTTFAFKAGGGADLAFASHLALRIEPDYLRTRILGRDQNNFLFSAGIVLRMRD